MTHLDVDGLKELRRTIGWPARALMTVQSTNGDDAIVAEALSA